MSKQYPDHDSFEKGQYSESDEKEVEKSDYEKSSDCLNWFSLEKN